MIKNYLKLSLLLSAIVWLAIGLIQWNQPTTTVHQGPGTNPGYADQFREMKSNSQGVIPRVDRKAWYNQSKLMKKASQSFESIKEVGPHTVGGRTRALIIDKANDKRLLAGGVSGGLWISEDDGSSWQAVNDYQSSLAVTCITQNPFSHNEFYYGTGENLGNSTGIPGDGIFFSKNGGQSFTQLDSTLGNEFNYIWDVQHSLTDPSTIYVATANSGLWRSKDKGKNFEKIYSTSRHIFSIHCREDSTIYFNVERNGIYKTKESHINPTRIGGGLPTTGFYKTQIAFSGQGDSIQYAAFTNYSGSLSNDVLGVYRSDDKGETWKTLTNPTNTTNVNFNYGWYCWMLGVSPDDPDFVVLGAAKPVFSDDGGQTWKKLEDSHSDYHIAVHPKGKNYYYIGNDGGVYKYFYSSSEDEFTDLNNGYNVTQFYAGSFFPEGDDYYGGTQDNGTWHGKLVDDSLEKVYGGDGSYCAVGQTDEMRYFSSQNGNLWKYDVVDNRRTRLYNRLSLAAGTTGDFWFINPFEVNPVDEYQVYYPTKNFIIRSTDAGGSFEKMTNRVIGNAYCIGLSSQEQPLMYYGGSSSILFRVENAFAAQPGDEINMWSKAPQEFKGNFIGNIEIDPNDESTIYIAMTNFSTNSRIWKISYADTDTAKYEPIGSNLPENVPVNWIEVDPKNSKHIMVATDFGLYTSTNGGGYWQLVEEIPNVSIPMIRLRESDRTLFIYTHGRGVWVADLEGEAVGIDNSIEETVNVFPNPATDQIRISGFNFERGQIYNLKGQVMSEFESTESIDISNLNSGMYVLRMIRGDQVITKKIQKH